MYAAKMKTEPEKMLKNLWGDRFYFPKEKKWKGEKGPGGKVRRDWIAVLVGAAQVQ